MFLASKQAQATVQILANSKIKNWCQVIVGHDQDRGLELFVSCGESQHWNDELHPSHRSNPDKLFF